MAQYVVGGDIDKRFNKLLKKINDDLAKYPNTPPKKKEALLGECIDSYIDNLVQAKKIKW
tara:strand:- start:488 stop:667 length:180 start_codon:yes stop_codon:yes gene_type:complete